jgi:elongation factor P
MADEADISKKEVMFLYENRDEYWFCDPKDKGNRFKLDVALIGDTAKFLKADGAVTALVWTNEDDEERIIKLALPIKVNFKVKEAAPAVRGDTAKGGNKTVTLENGTAINVPMFINEGDTIVINTETGEYVERV